MGQQVLEVIGVCAGFVEMFHVRIYRSRENTYGVGYALRQRTYEIRKAKIRLVRFRGVLLAQQGEAKRAPLLFGVGKKQVVAVRTGRI